MTTAPEQIALETVLKEMHKADDLVETHSQLVITVSGAAFGFAATRLDQPLVVYFVSFFGLLVAIEWLLKIRRHRQISSAARTRWSAMDAALKIETVRPIGSPNGFDILRVAALVLIIMWAVTVASVFLHVVPEKEVEADQAYAQVVQALSPIAGAPGSWRLISLDYDAATHTDKLVLERDAATKGIWRVTFDTTRDRVVRLSEDPTPTAKP